MLQPRHQGSEASSKSESILPYSATERKKKNRKQWVRREVFIQRKTWDQRRPTQRQICKAATRTLHHFLSTQHSCSADPPGHRHKAVSPTPFTASFWFWLFHRIGRMNAIHVMNIIEARRELSAIYSHEVLVRANHAKSKSASPRQKRKCERRCPMLTK